MYVLDSSALIETIQHTDRFERVKEIIKDAPLVTTSLCMHEMLSSTHLSEKDRFILEHIFSTMTILAHDAPSALLSGKLNAQLTKQGKKIGEFDVLISAICIIHHATLVTFDSDFKKIPGLIVAGV